MSEPRASEEDAPLAVILAEIRQFLTRFVVFASVSQEVAVTLWIAHTYLFDRFDTTPYLAVMSPQRRSGKSRLFEVLRLLVNNPWLVITPSEAVTFRKIHAGQPTILLDEVDTIYGPKAREHESLRAILCAGHRRGATVPRCVGQSHEVQDFRVFCPKALAGIGTLPDTVSDRSIPIQLHRRAPDQHVEKLRSSTAKMLAEPIVERLRAWSKSASVADLLLPDIPASLDDRAADGWEPLLTIADLAGGVWPEHARAAAVALHSSRDDREETLAVQLLRDLQAIFETYQRPSLFTDELIRGLVALEEAPWGDLEGKPIGPRLLARLLKQFGISSRSVRRGLSTAKGYLREDFEKPWRQYLPARHEGPTHRHTGTPQAVESCGESETSHACDGVTDSRPTGGTGSP